MRKCSRIFFTGLAAILICGAAMNPLPASTAGQFTYMAKNGATGKTDIFLTDSTGQNTRNLTESLRIGNVTGFSWSPDGLALALSDDQNVIYRLDMSTNELETLAEEGFDPAWSPLGDTIVYTSIHDGNREIYAVGDINLTHSKSEEYHPVWTREGKIIFFSNWEDPSRVYLYFMESDGQNVHNYETTDGLPAFNQVCLNREYGNEVFSMSWSPDYTRSVFSRDTSIWGGPKRGEIVIQDIDTGLETRLFEAEGLNIYPLWSPDGAKIAFFSDRDSYMYEGSKESVYNLYVMNTDGSGQTRITNFSTADQIIKAAWRPLTEQTAVSENAGAHPAALSLGPVFPNPFNPSTTITFALPAEGTASLAIYSITGQLVRVLADGHFSAGEHRVAWDGRDGNGQAVSSGVYLTRLEAQGRTASSKITLLR